MGKRSRRPPQGPRSWAGLRGRGTQGGGATAQVPAQRPQGGLAGARTRPPLPAQSQGPKSTGRRPDSGLGEAAVRRGQGSGGTAAERAPARPPPQGARRPALLPPSGHAAAPPPRPTSFPGRSGDERRPAGRGAGPRGGRRAARGYAARSPRGAAGVRGAGRPARRRRSGRGTPSCRPRSGLSLALCTRVRGRECAANFAAGGAASGGLPLLGSRERVDVGLRVAVTSCARVCGGNA